MATLSETIGRLLRQKTTVPATLETSPAPTNTALTEAHAEVAALKDPVGHYLRIMAMAATQLGPNYGTDIPKGADVYIFGDRPDDITEATIPLIDVVAAMNNVGIALAPKGQPESNLMVKASENEALQQAENHNLFFGFRAFYFSEWLRRKDVLARSAELVREPELTHGIFISAITHLLISQRVNPSLLVHFGIDPIFWQDKNPTRIAVALNELTTRIVLEKTSANQKPA